MSYSAPPSPAPACVGTAHLHLTGPYLHGELAEGGEVPAVGRPVAADVRKASRVAISSSTWRGESLTPASPRGSHPLLRPTLQCWRWWAEQRPRHAPRTESVRSPGPLPVHAGHSESLV